MSLENALSNLSGAQELFDWFGHWPSFHDAEVIGIELSREGVSRIRVHYFSTSGKTNSRGYYVTDKHVIISFLLEEIVELELMDFNQQNVLSSILIKSLEEGFEIILGGCYGVSGRVVANKLSFEFQPGMPENSVYAKATE